MRRRRKKYDIFILIFLVILTVGYYTYNKYSSEDRGRIAYSSAFEAYKDADYETAYKLFGKVPSASCMKNAALFRQARCATNLDRKDLAIRKYRRIVNSGSKSSIVPISEYNMATLMLETKNNQSEKHFRKIIKKYPTSDYAIASSYYLGLIEEDKKYSSKKGKQKSTERAFINFKTYIEKAPDGRYALKSIDEIKKLGVKLKNYDNLLISKAYYANGEYEKAAEFLNKTTLAESWADFAKNEYKRGNSDKVRYYTEYGLKDHSYSATPDDVYETIDYYIATYPTRKEGIEALVSKNYKNLGSDYIDYLKCSEVVQNPGKEACYTKYYDKYQNKDGKFLAESLFNLFIIKYLNGQYYDAQRLGFLHIKKFQNAKSSPAVAYFMGKIAHKLKHYESENSYFKQVISKFPDSYYAYRANYNLHKDDGAFPFTDFALKPVVFPYKKSLENNLVIKLSYIKDYDLVDELCKKDKFIQSWIAYQKGNYTISAILARNAMEELEVKPPYNDLRWRLIYPLHYFSIVEKNKGGNNPIIIQSIIKEESHFNSYATSGVGAAGLMQLMPGTYNEINNNYGLSGDIYSPENNIRAGCLYYSGLKKVLGSKDLYAISAYNGGIGSVTNWFSKIKYTDTDEFVEQIPYPETKNYVKKVLRSYWMYGNIY